MVTNWTAGEHASCFKRINLCSRNRRLPGVEEPFTAAEKGRHVEMCRDHSGSVPQYLLHLCITWKTVTMLSHQVIALLKL
jgi:hypothetical protein